jgi:hypothetical protein
MFSLFSFSWQEKQWANLWKNAKGDYQGQLNHSLGNNYIKNIKLESMFGLYLSILHLEVTLRKTVLFFYTCCVNTCGKTIL